MMYSHRMDPTSTLSSSWRNTTAIKAKELAKEIQEAES